MLTSRGVNLFHPLPFIRDGLGRTWEPRLVEDVICRVLVEFKLFVQRVVRVISRCRELARSAFSASIG